MKESAPIWYIRTGDHVQLNDKTFEVLEKDLIPLGYEVGFSLDLKEEDTTECSRALFYWTDEIICFK